MLVIMPLLMGILVWVITADANAGLLILACVHMGYVTGLPVFLWSGYILGIPRGEQSLSHRSQRAA